MITAAKDSGAKRAIDRITTMLCKLILAEKLLPHQVLEHESAKALVAFLSGKRSVDTIVLAYWLGEYIWSTPYRSTQTIRAAILDELKLDMTLDQTKALLNLTAKFSYLRFGWYM